MRAAIYNEFGGSIKIADVAVPQVRDDGAVIVVEATGVCRSDWHGWQGHDADITTLPHVPGHEFAGVVTEVGRHVSRIRPGMRVIVPFICACGSCDLCLAGNGNVCPNQYQPGFHGWGSYAEQVAVRYADHNLVEMPESMEPATAAILGCRVATAYRAIVDQAAIQGGEWLVVHGVGGVGLSVAMIGHAHGAMVIASDPDPAARALALDLGACHVLDPSSDLHLATTIRNLTDGGAHVSVDAVGAAAVTAPSLHSLRTKGRHIQVGLLGSPVEVPMSLLHSKEIAILGSHGMPAADYPRLLGEIESGRWDPQLLITQRLSLEEGVSRLIQADPPPGIAVISDI